MFGDGDVTKKIKLTDRKRAEEMILRRRSDIMAKRSFVEPEERFLFVCLFVLLLLLLFKPDNYQGHMRAIDLKLDNRKGHRRVRDLKLVNREGHMVKHKLLNRGQNTKHSSSSH